MGDWPRISIVTPSLNQGAFIAETIESVKSQEYPNLEHIVIDGGSTDGTLEVLGRYSHLRVVSEPDQGHANAINKGFRLATGRIWGFLNSDDILLPGALHRVKEEIDPGRMRCIVMGRCRFIDEQGRYIGIEHPSAFTNHQRVLAIWKGYSIPQPAVFWTPEVWHTCGPLDENLPFAWIDYDLFCRFSKKYEFRFVDHVFAAYRLHTESKTVGKSEDQRLEEAIAISRRYWGTPLSIVYWRLKMSLAFCRLDRTGRAVRWLREANNAWRRRLVLEASFKGVLGTVLAPEVAWNLAVYPVLRDWARKFIKAAMQRSEGTERMSPQTAAYRDFTDIWPDGWVGPQVVVQTTTEVDASFVLIEGEVKLQYLDKPFTLTVLVSDRVVGRQVIDQDGHFEFKLPLLWPLPLDRSIVKIEASSWFVPDRLMRNGDLRPLSWRLGKVCLSA